MKRIPAKTIITRTTHPECWFGGNYNMNIYRGCSHGCIYCDSRSDCYQVAHFEEITAKENALGIIEKELRGKRNPVCISDLKKGLPNNNGANVLKSKIFTECWR